MPRVHLLQSGKIAEPGAMGNGRVIPIQFELLDRAWHVALSQLVAQTDNDLLIATPFITDEGTRLVVDRLPSNVRTGGQLRVLTDLSPTHVCDGWLQPAAISALYDAVRFATLWHIPRLHAKVYVSDHQRAIVTSGNLTATALYKNVEYGVDVRDSTIVAAIIEHFAFFQATGATVSRNQLARYEAAAAEVQQELAKVRRSASSAAKRAFQHALREAEDELVRVRLAGGAMHTVFARTVEFLLRKHGPMTTVRIHEFIKELHPELCDDSVDRVIDGEHFGKKWKHAVRTSQQMLKKRGLIQYADGLWRLMEDKTD